VTAPGHRPQQQAGASGRAAAPGAYVAGAPCRFSGELLFHSQAIVSCLALGLLVSYLLLFLHPNGPVRRKAAKADGAARGAPPPRRSTLASQDAAASQRAVEAPPPATVEPAAPPDDGGVQEVDLT
jgi:hypothetical protein